MWERLGGFRQRYAPKGAGCEDAEFWLRAGAYGMGAKIVDDRPLFVYSAGTGQTFHDREYGNIDWLCWHPWTKDFQHPLASLATPKHISHPVRQYDEPVVSVVIPVGPGHEYDLINALDSLEAQTYRKWEVICVNDTGKSDWCSFYKTAYPYIRWVQYPRNHGTGYARNRGVDAARAPFIFYLDADDRLYPECLEKHLISWKENETIVYSDYVGKSTVDDINKLAPDLRGRVYRYDTDTHEAVIGYRAAEYDCERALRQPDEKDVYLWCNVTVLIPKKWHDAIGGFDESMVTREDVDYHWRLARAGYCYTRIPEELFVYCFNTGTRRSVAYTNRQIAEVLLSYLKDKYAKDKPMGCACRGNKGPSPTAHIVPQAQGANSKMMSDDDLVMVRYLSPNKGSHSVIGPSKQYYGYRSGGDTFLVKKEDIALAPHLFSAIEGAVGNVQGPPKEVIPLEAPPDLTAEPKRRGRPPKK
jgi:glycosyltransferase involved in cell wall biosynthesis